MLGFGRKKATANLPFTYQAGVTLGLPRSTGTFRKAMSTEDFCRVG
jgi:hypothetical protein